MLDQETAVQSGHEERRGILSMSHLHLSDAEIVQQFRDGVQMDGHQKLKLYLGTLCERGIRERLEAICAAGAGVWTKPKEIRAFNGRLTGHIDGAIDKTLVEIKTVPTVKALEEMKLRSTIPYKVESQINSYMLWGPYERTLLIYEERETGTHWITEHFPNKHLQRDLHFKAEYILKTLAGNGVTVKKPNIILVKELRHAILQALKAKASNGKRAELFFGELWNVCAAAGPSLAAPLNADLQREAFTKALIENLKFLSTTDVVGVITAENEEKIESVFLTKIGEDYVNGIEFR
jgi:hypothetical protein